MPSALHMSKADFVICRPDCWYFCGRDPSVDLLCYCEERVEKVRIRLSEGLSSCSGTFVFFFFFFDLKLFAKLQGLISNPALFLVIKQHYML